MSFRGATNSNANANVNYAVDVLQTLPWRALQDDDDSQGQDPLVVTFVVVFLAMICLLCIMVYQMSSKNA